MTLIAQMSPAETGVIEGTSITAINNGHVTVFLQETSSGYILFDTGVDAEKLAESMKELGIALENVHTIFLSHSDRDHVAGLVLFPHAEIYLCIDEFPIIQGKIIRREGRYNSLPEEVEESRLLPVKDGQKLEINGINISSIQAPGHTPGSMLYLINDRFLFTGDAFSFVNGEIGIHPFTMDEDQVTQTIENLRTKMAKAEIILTSHYGVIYR